MDTMALSGRPERGNKDAKVTIVNYDDFECPFCSRVHQTLQVKASDGSGHQRSRLVD